MLRLFRRGRARFTDDPVHERVVCDGPVGRLAEPLLHYPVLRIEDAIGRMDRYSTAGALNFNAFAAPIAVERFVAPGAPIAGWVGAKVRF